MSIRRTALSVALVIVSGISICHAQSIHGGIQGTVVDDAGDGLPGVTVQLSSPDLQGTRSAVTDVEGEFRFVLLPPGLYVVQFALPGFQLLEQRNVRVPIEGVITLRVEMAATFAEEILVSSESPVVDVTSTAMSTRIDEQFLDNLPLGRDFKSVTFLAAGAVDGGGIANDYLAGNPSIMGSSALENRYVIDQLDTTDPAYGRAGSQLSTSFIEEVQVKTAGYEAEYGGALGGVVNMMTRSGGNEFHGDVFGYFTNDSLWEEALVPSTRGEAKTTDREWDVGLTLGGRLIRDKLWFFVGYNPSIQDQRVQNDLTTMDGEYVTTNDFTRTFNRDFLMAKLSWQVTQHHALNLVALGDPTTIESDYYRSNYVDSPYVPETNMFQDTRIGGINWGLSWNAIFSDEIFFEATLGQHRSREETFPYLESANYRDDSFDGRWTEGVGNGAYFGGSGFQQPKDDRIRDQVRAALTWFAGDAHELKIGGGYSRVEYDIDYNVVGPSDAFCSPLWPVDEPNPYWGWAGYNGALVYDYDVADYLTVVPDCDTDGDGIEDGLSMPARTGNRFRLYDADYYGGYGNSNYKNRSTGKTTEYNLYFQDAWRIRSNLTLSLGVRLESSESVGDFTRHSPDYKLEFGLGDMIAPRVGFVWDPADNGRSRVFGHYARFYESIPLDINVRAFGNEQFDFYYYRYPESGLPGTTNPGHLTYIFNAPSGWAVVDPEIEPQHLEELVLGGEYEVLPDAALGLTYVKRWIGRVIEDISLDNAFTYVITNPGGTYTVNPATGLPLDPPVFYPEMRRNFDGVELSLSKRYSHNWQAYLSLLWSRLEGNFEGLYSRRTQQLDPHILSAFDLPHLLENADGLLPNDREWELKLFGSYNFDFGLVVGANFFYVTGTPLSKLGRDRLYGGSERFVTQRGSEGRDDDWANLDLHLAYALPIRWYRLEFIIDVFNVFDEQASVEPDQVWTIYDQDDPEPDAQTNFQWGEPLVYSPPRHARFGIKFSW
jgi:hypothetical protein